MAWEELGITVPTPHAMSEPRKPEEGSEPQEVKTAEPIPPVCFPLVGHDLKKLPVHFLNEGEDEDALVKAWLDIVDVSIGTESVKVAHRISIIPNSCSVLVLCERTENGCPLCYQSTSKTPTTTSSS